MSEANPRPTLKDVARAAQVHFTTVSLALRDSARIPPATRDRIRRIAQAMDYHRDPIFMALTERRLGSQREVTMPRVAYLTNWPDQASFEQRSYRRLFFAGAQSRAAALGFECELVLVGGKTWRRGELDEHLRRRRCEGVIIGAFEPRFPPVTVDWSRYALAKIDTRFMEPSTAFVSNDQAQVVRLAFQRLRALGYRRIGMAVGRADEESTHDLWAGACLIEQADRPAPEVTPPLHFEYDETVSSIVPRLRDWVARHRIEAVISNWLNIETLLRTAGCLVPRHVACACLSLEGTDRRVAGVIQNYHLVGQKAAEILALNLKTGQRGVPEHASETYVPGAWQDGDSAPAKA